MTVKALLITPLLLAETTLCAFSSHFNDSTKLITE